MVDFFSISYHYYVRRHDRLRRACIVRVSLFHVGSVANVALYIFYCLSPIPVYHAGENTIVLGGGNTVLRYRQEQ